MVEIIEMTILCAAPVEVMQSGMPRLRLASSFPCSSSCSGWAISSMRYTKNTTQSRRNLMGTLWYCYSSCWCQSLLWCVCQWLKSTWLHCICYCIQTYYGCLHFHCSGDHEPIEMSETYDVIQRNTQPTQKLLSDTDPAYKKLEKVLCICHTYSAVCDTRCCECVVLSNQCGNFVKCSLSFFTQTFAIRDMDQFPLTKFIKRVMH